MGHRRLQIIALALGVAGCSPTIDPTAKISLIDTDKDIPTGACTATDRTPAVIETRIEDVLVSPAVIGDDGTVIKPAVFRTDTRQLIVQERQDIRFETPCPPVLDQDFLASLQRALKARGHYQGPINGRMDGDTRRAIRSYQAVSGLQSDILSMDAARRLGLLV